MGEFFGLRDQRLEEAKRQVERLYTDYEESGKEHVGIDPELKEGIAVFLAMGMQTESSCWGHPERRDNPHALAAEQNLFPYISFSGFEPNDGLNEHGAAVGYSDAQVDAACARMKADASTLHGLLKKFYEQQEAPLRIIELIYYEDMPTARLVTHDAERLESVHRNEQDVAIRNARGVWEAFLDFTRNTYKQAEHE